jgi:hypothetical protein
MDPTDATGTGDHPRAGTDPADDGFMSEDRALRAMAEAARRARDTVPGRPVLPPPPQPPGARRGRWTTSRAPSGEDEPSASDGSGSRPPHHGVATDSAVDGEVARAPRWRPRRVAEIAILAGLLIAAVIIGLNVGGGTSRTRAVAPASQHPSTASTAPAAPAAPSPSAGPAPASTAPPSTTALPSTTAPPPPTAGGGPQISSISPAAGTAGQVVTVSGANLVSSDGQVLARFNGQAAGTQCPTRTSCTVTVPSLSGGTSSVTVTITTAEGTSNALPFSYG